MNKKIIVLIGAIFCVLLIIIIVSNINENKMIRNGNQSDIKGNHSMIIQDEETREYVVYNKETGEEVARSDDIVDLYIYEQDPEYNPGIPGLSMRE